MAEIKAVTFDVGGTLLKPSPSVGEIYARVAREYGVDSISPEVLNDRFAAAWRNLSHFNYSREDWASLVRHVFDGLTNVPSETFFPAVYDYFAKAPAWHIFDDVLPALDRLASIGQRLAVISNWDERLRPLLHDLRLVQYFDALIVSSEIGFHKPSPVIFEYAARKIGLPAGAILHIGDSLDHDVTGARNAGFHAIELRRSASGAVGNGIISSLMEIDLAAF